MSADSKDWQQSAPEWVGGVGARGLWGTELSISFRALRDGPSPPLDRVLSHEARELSLYEHGVRLSHEVRPRGAWPLPRDAWKRERDVLMPSCDVRRPSST
jgi:hypothetical protein